VEIKTFEVRDEGTHIPVMCIRGRVCDEPSEVQYNLMRGGWGKDSTFLYFIGLADCGCQHDAFQQGNRTRHTAHLYVQEHWDELKSGDVIDVEFILGITDEPKMSELLTVGY